MPAPARAALLAVLFAALLAACQTEEEAPPASPTPAPDAQATPTASPQPEGTLWRWVNVTVVVPEESDVYVLRDDAVVGTSGPVLRVLSGWAGDGSRVSIDAETGAVVYEDVRPQDRPLFDLILKTIEVAPLDRQSAPWPYNGDAPETKAGERIGRYVLPELSPELGLALRVFSDGPLFGVEISNGRSRLRIPIDEQGEPEVDFSRVLNEDRAVFERLWDGLRPCEAERC